VSDCPLSHFYDTDHDNVGESFEMPNTTDSFAKSVGAISRLWKASRDIPARSTAFLMHANQEMLKESGISMTASAAQTSATLATSSMPEKNSNTSTSVVYLVSHHNVCRVHSVCRKR
jgi:hypothetical protein